MEKFYTVKEFGALLKINIRTVNNLISSGRLKAVDVGTGKRKIWRIYDGELQRFMAESYQKKMGCHD